MGSAISCYRAPPFSLDPSLEYYSPRIVKILEDRIENSGKNKVESEVEASKVTWSEVSQSNVVGETLAAENSRVFRSLQQRWPGGFFKEWVGGGWEVGERLAEGGQAELFEAWRVTCEGKRVHIKPWVMKMFKVGLSLKQLQSQLPLGMLADDSTRSFGFFSRGIYCNALDGALLVNGRFALLMDRKWGDLRKLIDVRMIHNGMHEPPFTENEAGVCMLEIAIGMKELHSKHITHGDLKAANVLVRTFDAEGHHFDAIHGDFVCQVADYECSVGVVGTGFWRAPEILLAVKNQAVTPQLFTEATDVYSYGMTCYEILTGRIPFEFEELKFTDYDRVIEGYRPSLPRETPRWMKALLSVCWHKDSLKRPTFEEIERILLTHLKYVGGLQGFWGRKRLVEQAKFRLATSALS